MASHAICKRIRISCPDGRSENPTWSDEEVAKIQRQSPLFERQVLRLLQNTEHVWKIEAKVEDGFHEVDNLGLFITNLGRSQVIEMEVEELSSRCSAMWYFEVVPSRVHLASCARDSTGKVIASSSATAITSSTPSVASPGAAHAVSNGSAQSGSQPNIWCWNYHGGHSSPDTPLKLTNIALVLNWREVFQREIKSVIWNWPGRPPRDTNTPIRYLQEDDVKGLNWRRQQEMEAIRNWFDLHFTNNSKLPQRVKDKIKRNGPEEFDNQNPYSWMRSLENTLLPSDKSHRRHSGLSQNTMATNDHYRGGGPSGPSLSQVIKRKAAQRANNPEDRKIVEEKLTEAHKFIEERQAMVAEKLLAWRDRQVGRWESVLKETETSVDHNGAPGAGETSSGSEEQQHQPERGPTGPSEGDEGLS